MNLQKNIYTIFNGNIITQVSFGDEVFDDEAFAVIENLSWQTPQLQDFIIATSKFIPTTQGYQSEMVIYEVTVVNETCLPGEIRTFNHFNCGSYCNQIIPTVLSFDRDANLIIGGWTSTVYDTMELINNDVPDKDVKTPEPDFNTWGFILNCGPGMNDSVWMYYIQNGSKQTRFYDIDTLNDGNLIVTGWSEHKFPGICMLRSGNLIKLNSNGVSVWQKLINYYDYRDVEFYSLENMGLYFAIAGSIEANMQSYPRYNILFSRTYSNGTLIDYQTYGDNWFTNFGYSICQGNGSFHIAGFRKGEEFNGLGCNLQIDQTGGFSSWFEKPLYSNFRSIYKYSPIPMNPGYITCGTIFDPTGEDSGEIQPNYQKDIILCYRPSLAPQDNITPSVVSDNEISMQVLNVLTKEFDIIIDLNIQKDDNYTIEAYNVLGQKVCSVYNGYLSAGEASIRSTLISSSGELLQNGVYFLHVESENGSVLNHKISILE